MVPVKPFTKSPIFLPTTAPTKKVYVCTNSFICPSHSYRIPGRYCYDTFDDCQCNTGYVKDVTKKQCTSIPTKPPTNVPTRPPTNMPSLRPNAPTKRPSIAPIVAPIALTLRPTIAPTKKVYVCTNSFICPSNSYRIPRRYCYDTFDDCQCNTGYVKDNTKKQCTPVPTKSPTSAPKRPPTNTPTLPPTILPTGLPTIALTLSPTITATTAATAEPTTALTMAPSDVLCTHNFICPSNSERIPGRKCYETLDDCQCVTGYVRDNNYNQCVPDGNDCDDDDDDYYSYWLSLINSFWGSRHRQRCGDD